MRLFFWECVNSNFILDVVLTSQTQLVHSFQTFGKCLEEGLFHMMHLPHSELINCYKHGKYLFCYGVELFRSFHLRDQKESNQTSYHLALLHHFLQWNDIKL